MFDGANGAGGGNGAQRSEREGKDAEVNEWWGCERAGRGQRDKAEVGPASASDFFDPRRTQCCHLERGRASEIFAPSGRPDGSITVHDSANLTISCPQNRTEPGIMDRHTIHDPTNTERTRAREKIERDTGKDHGAGWADGWLEYGIIVDTRGME
jgi:hypothetical protein